jgi:hypothetical protein
MTGDARATRAARRSPNACSCYEGQALASVLMADEQPDLFGERLRDTFLSRRAQMLPPLSPKQRKEREQQAARERERSELAAVTREAAQLVEELRRR